MNFEAWNEWDNSIHTDPEQIKRQLSAAKADMTPVSLKNDFAVFRGSKKDYETTLSACTCTDFAIRGLPCKHMYRLAHELDLFHLDDVKTDSSVSVQLRINEAMSIIESLPEESQKIFHDIIYQCQYGAGYDIISSEDAKILFDKKLIKQYPQKSVLLKKLKKSELIAFIPNPTSEILKYKKVELINYIDTNFPSVYDHLLDDTELITLDDSVSKLAIAMNRRLCQKFPREESSWITY